jgi:hypothetical protein
MKRKYNKTYFKSSDINTLNADLPLTLKELEPAIHIISQQYPLLKKSEVSLIIKTLMEEMREQLIQGNIIHIYNFLLNMNLYTFCKLRKNKITFNTKVQVNTPLKIRNKNVIK